PTHTAPPEPCEDVLPNCADYGTGVCSLPEYEKWAHDNCRHFCDLCATSPPPTTTVWTTPASGCFDGISYCSDYGRQVCDDNSYKAWVNQNCKKFCGVCGDQSTLSTATSAGTTTPAECADKITNCAAYPESSCGGQYLYWARDNCKKTCGYCDEQTTGAGGTATTAPPTCVDTINNCAAYGTQYCGGDYLAWAADNCAAFCRLCDDFELTTARAVTAQPGWVVLMKGVKGVPGDLWKLWSGTNTSNENVPQAQYLTNQYPGNYKSPYANSWGTCRFEQVKVAIYSGGQEKANIIFDVRSASKNDWFRPDNVVSSTWNVLPQTSDQFGTASDPHGHQFAVGDFHGCSGTGFLLVSTEDNSCPYEDTGSPNRFLYSPHATATQLSQGNLAEGDVFAVLGHGGICAGGGAPVFTTQQSITGRTEGCFYNGQMYGQNAVWQDACDYNCTCEDATTGYYSCVELCPTYTNIPAGCALVKQPGECCEKLDCPNVPGNGCYYKQHAYPEGTTWQDGCDFKCTCSDGTSGYYQCRSLCPTWDTLPSECTLVDPPAGECCSTPSCPPGYEVQTLPPV
ncbi:hypothetical protein BaRGS_00017381, partial [Batillaria attramentaria]